MSLLSFKTKMTLEEFFRQFYDSQIFNLKTDSQDKSQAFWNKLLISLIQEAGHPVSEINPFLIQCEMISLRMELLGLAWIDYLYSQLNERYRESERHYCNEEMAVLTSWEINFTKTYLQENNHIDIWDCMGVYNKTFEFVKPATLPNQDDRRDSIIEKQEKPASFECDSRLRNRHHMQFHFKGFSNYPEESILSKTVAVKLAERLCLNIKSDSKVIEALESFILLLYYDAKERLERVTLLMQIQMLFDQPFALLVNRLLYWVSGLFSLLAGPIAFISIPLVAMIDLLTFGLLLSILNLIWIFFFLGPLLFLSHLWQVAPPLRLSIAIIGTPLAALAENYVGALPSLMPMYDYGSKIPDMLLCKTWPFTQDCLAFEMGKLSKESDKFYNVAPILSKCRGAVLYPKRKTQLDIKFEKYLDNAELKPRPLKWFLDYLILDILEIAGAVIIFYFLWQFHWILAIIAIIPVNIFIKYLIARFVLKVP